MANQNQISSLLQDASYYLVNKHYNNILRSQYALYTNDDYEEHEIQCLRLLIKSLSREFVVDYTSNITQQLYAKLTNIVVQDNLDDYSVDTNLQKSNQTIIIVNNSQDIQQDINTIYINIADLQTQININKNNITTINTNIVNINTNITNIENDITNIENDIILIDGNINYLQSEIDALENVVDNLETTFLGLTDTPNTYSGQASKLIVVNQAQDALEFIVQPITKTQITSVSDVTVGAINAGDSIPQNLNIEELKNLIFNKTFYPSLNAPSFSLSNNAGLREIGELANFTSTFNFNRGSIILQGITQNPRAGASNTYIINGITQSSNVLSLTNYPVLQGNNTITGIVNYLIGPQPLDSKGNIFSIPLTAGTSPTQSTSFEGVYPLFGTTFNITTSTKQSLVSMISGNNVQINLVAESGGNKQFFEIPNAWGRTLTSIQYFNTVSGQFDTTNKLADFVTSSTTKTIQGLSVNYTKYTYTGSDRANILIRLIFN